MTQKSEPSSSTAGLSRKERRAAERSMRKGGTVTTTTKRSSGPSLLVITFAAVVIGVVAILGLIAISGGFDGDDTAAVARPDEPAPAAELRHGRSLGDPAAPVRIEAFEDPQCPACGLFNARIKPLLLAGPISDGQVYFTYKDFPFLGPESLDAAAAMRVAEKLDGKFWDMHEMLFHNQHGENQGAFSLDRLADMAELIGLDREAFLEGMDDPAFRAAAEAEHQEGVALGASSTPTLVVAGELIRGVPTWNDLSAKIDAAAEAAAAGTQ